MLCFMCILDDASCLQYLVREKPGLFPDLMQERSDSPMSLPADIVLLSALFPFPPEPLPIEKLDDFVPLLPSYKTVLFLSELYYTTFGWWYVQIRHVWSVFYRLELTEITTARIRCPVLCSWLRWLQSVIPGRNRPHLCDMCPRTSSLSCSCCAASGC